MWRTGRVRSLAKRSLPAVLLLSTLMGGPAAIAAQQPTPETKAFQPAITSTDSPPEALTPERLGDTRLIERRYQEAIEAYQDAPNSSSEVWNKRGIAYEMLFDLKDAARCFKQSLRLNPLDSRVLNNLATIYDSQKDHRKAERLYRRALTLAPASPLILLDLGTNLVLQEKYEQGREMYKRAVSIDPGVLDSMDAPIVLSPMSHHQTGAINYYKAKGFAQAGKREEAVTYLRRALHEGYASPSKIAQDSSFTQLHGVPKFDELLAEPGD